MKYFFTILYHKFIVFKIGLKLNVPIIRLLRHDMSKFSFKEFFIYRKRFSGMCTQKELTDINMVFLHHQNRNEHHWEYWCNVDIVNDKVVTHFIEMPEVCVREMVADWIAASIVYEGKYPTLDDWEWLEANLEIILKNVHRNTAELIECLLVEMNLIYGENCNLDLDY